MEKIEKKGMLRIIAIPLISILHQKATYENDIQAAIIKIDYRVDKVAKAIYESDIPDFYGDFLLA